MNFRMTALLGALLVVLLAFLFLYERPRMTSEREAAEAEKAFIDVARNSVSKLTLVNKYGRFVAEKRGSDWFLVEPVETVGDWAQLEDLVTSAKAVERGRVVVDSAAYVSGEVDLASFGLKPPQVEVRFVSEADDEIWLFFGDDNPAGRAAYMSWSGSNKVVLTQRYQRNRFELPLMELRDRRMLPFDPDEVEQLRIETPDEVIVVNRSHFIWEIAEPFKMRADDVTVNRILGDLKSAQIAEVVSESVENPEAYGLASPQYRVILGRKGSAPSHILLLGKEMPGNRQSLWYGRYTSRPYVFAVEPYVVNEILSVPPSALRYRQVFEFDRAGIDRIELAYPDSSVVCEKSADGNWSVLRPANHQIENRNAENWIDLVHNLRADHFVDEGSALADYGLDEPIMVASVWRAGKLVREVSFGRTDQGWFAKRRDSDEVVGVPYTVFQGLRLRARPLKKSQNQEAGAGA